MARWRYSHWVTDELLFFYKSKRKETLQLSLFVFSCLRVSFSSANWECLFKYSLVNILSETTTMKSTQPGQISSYWPSQHRQNRLLGVCVWVNKVTRVCMLAPRHMPEFSAASQVTLRCTQSPASNPLAAIGSMHFTLTFLLHFLLLWKQISL